MKIHWNFQTPSLKIRNVYIYELFFWCRYRGPSQCTRCQCVDPNDLESLVCVSLIHRSSIFLLVKVLTKNTELCREHRPGFFLREKGCQDHRNRANASLAFTPSCWKLSNVQNAHLFWRMGRYAQIVSMATALLQPHAFVRIRPSLCQQSAP